MARVEQSIEVNVPVSTAYNQLTQFEEYPRFMEDVKEVRQIDDTHLHWHTKAGNLDMEWDAEITQQVPDRCIAWRNTSGPRYEGKIELHPTQDDRTKVTLTMECDPKQQVLAQHGDAESAIAQRTEHDLARFKKFIEKLGRETGEWRGRVSNAQPVPPAGDDRTSGADIGKTVGQTAEERQDAAGAAQPQALQQAGQGAQRGGEQRAKAGEAWSLQSPWMPGLLQVWNEPLGMMRKMTEDMDHLIERFIGRPMYGVGAPSAPAAAWTPPVEIAQRDDRFVVCAELAGVKREDVRVEIKNDQLTIEGDRRPELSNVPQELRRSERSYGHFYRVIALPPGTDANAASASMHDGMLEITVPVAGNARHGRQLEIQSPQQ